VHTTGNHDPDKTGASQQIKAGIRPLGGGGRTPETSKARIKETGLRPRRGGHKYSWAARTSPRGVSLDLLGRTPTARGERMIFGSIETSFRSLCTFVAGRASSGDLIDTNGLLTSSTTRSIYVRREVPLERSGACLVFGRDPQGGSPERGRFWGASGWRIRDLQPLCVLIGSLQRNGHSSLVFTLTGWRTPKVQPGNMGCLPSVIAKKGCCTTIFRKKKSWTSKRRPSAVGVTTSATPTRGQRN